MFPDVSECPDLGYDEQENRDNSCQYTRRITRAQAVAFENVSRMQVAKRLRARVWISIVDKDEQGCWIGIEDAADWQGMGALMESGREYSECQPPLKNRDRQLLIQVRMKTTSHVHPGLLGPL